MSTVPQPAQKTPKAKILTMSPTLHSELTAMSEEFCLIESIPAIALIPKLEYPDLKIYNRANFTQTLCSDRSVEGKSVAVEWMKWPNRNKVKSVTYSPGKPLFFDNQLNTWIPSKLKPVKGDITLFLSYLDHIFSSDSTHRDWFEAWLAFQFQHPGIKLATACVFWSPETGTGKSLFGYIMAELFGQHNFAEINESELFGKFNFWATRKQFVMGEEIKGTNSQKHNDFIKSVITRRFVTIDNKHTPHYTLPDCINYFFTSNRPMAFSLDNTDRRFFVHRLGEKKLEADYVEKILKPWLLNGGYEAILYHLIHDIDLTKSIQCTGKPFNPFGAAPQTAARMDMVNASRDEMDIWIDELAASEGDTFDNTPGWKLASAEDLYDSFCNAFKRARIPYRTFAAAIKNSLPSPRGGNKILISTSLPKKRIYCPPNALCGYEGMGEMELISRYSEGRPTM